MSDQEARSVSKLACEEPGCNLKTFSTRSNLIRHNKSKHGQKVRMPCGKNLPNHACNCRRHKKSCQKCRAALVQPSTPEVHDNLGPSIHATEITTFDLALETYAGGPDAMGDIMDGFYFEAHPSENHH
ncbi:hypothetical protein CTAM01_01763 [Colletotrichum tamarilloi]|uniref:C2H2-type domain-containing protein n=1 Tax=Colletotrichum tamarilloi TaxID=1209934 RepID=A0ABQ9RPF4_9PEZI|nr:uncharacterized protein CTAM01_01763 [Colletotrichum tamarilloi]KAK1509640.1 hypothetical protein CTAM01_01763 [Colletotrichum tamarilloi]